MTLAKKFKDLRERHNMTQEAVATALGLSRQSIAKWENGQSIPSMNNLIKLAQLFEISIEELTETKGKNTYSIETLEKDVPTHPSPLEQYALVKLAEEKKRKQLFDVLLTHLKQIASTSFYFMCLDVAYWFIYYGLGFQTYIWDWSIEYHIIPLICIVTIITEQIFQISIRKLVLLSTTVATLSSTLIGNWLTSQSVCKYNYGWVIYLNVLYILTIILIIKQNKFHNVPSKSNTRFLTILKKVYLLCISIVFLLTIFFSYRHIRIGIGAEAAYPLGYEAGVYDATMNHDFLTTKTTYDADVFPFGTPEYKGYHIYWSKGYSHGYEYIKEVQSSNHP